MEAITNSAEDHLIDALSFKLKPGSSYVIDRKSATFWASGSNTYSPNGTRVIRFTLAGEDNSWLDPSTLRVQFTVRNAESGKRIVPLSPAAFFARVRIMANGTLCEDLQSYNRVHHMHDCLKSKAVRDNELCEGFGYRFDDDNNRKATEQTLLTMPGINNGSTRVVSLKPLSGLLSQDKMINLKFCPITIEMEIVGSYDDAVITPRAPILGPVADDGNAINTTNVGTAWEILDCDIKTQIASLDNQLNNSYISHLLGGGTLPLSYKTWVTQQSSLPTGTNFSIQVARTFTRLTKLFITFFDSAVKDDFFDSKQAINLFHPMGEADKHSLTYNGARDLQFQVQVGSDLYPQYPVRSIQECYKILRQTLSLPDYGQHSISIGFKEYKSDHFIYAENFERVPQASFTGINSKAGQLVIIKVEPVKSSTLNGAVGSRIGESMCITLEADCMLEIKDGGCTVYD